MNYELLKQLKDAWFPRSENWKEEEDELGVFFTSEPTLSDLIEACGEQYETRYKITDDEHKVHYQTPMFFHLSKKYLTRDSARWVAGYYHSAIPTGSWIEAMGDTPEIALANLYLKFNKKA